MIAIEIQLLIDRLEALLIESRAVPFTSSVLIDRDRCFDIINQMRVSIPEEVKKAKRVQQERDRVIAQANEEAERIIALARDKASRTPMDRETSAQVDTRGGGSSIERAYRESDEIRAEADDYARDVLRTLENHLIEQLTTIRNGIDTLDGRISEKTR